MIDVENWLHLLGQEMHADFVLIGLGPQFNLSEDLIGERVAHDEARVAHSTAQVHETTLSQHDDMPAILHRVAVDLQCEVQAIKENYAYLSCKFQACDVFTCTRSSIKSNLWFDGIFLRTVLIQPFDIQLTVEVTNVADDSVLQHSAEHIALYDVFTTSGRDEDPRLFQCLFNCGHLVAYNNHIIGLFNRRVICELKSTTDGAVQVIKSNPR